MRLIIALVASISIFNAAHAQEPKTYTFTVTGQEVGQIGQALGDRPFREVNALLRKLESQMVEQDKPKDAKPPEKPENPAKPEETSK